MSDIFDAAAVERHKDKRFLMIFRGERQWLTFTQCARALDGGMCADGRVAIDLNDRVVIERSLTEEEKRDITNAADDWSGAK